jgi:hypothetical protein
MLMTGSAPRQGLTMSEEAQAIAAIRSNRIKEHAT